MYKEKYDGLSAGCLKNHAPLITTLIRTTSRTNAVNFAGKSAFNSPINAKVSVLSSAASPNRWRACAACCRTR
ncbi:hypothetical protein QG053_10085 [Kingella kingae]|uniref:hypothetical protein n=1 Tax=Kingella kingae TaxID=504 RepID=UPI00254E121D|nr:hypothetical protein [Kingella kingae]MDK4565373.1 hypothetical protein [Kingella kingae]MDK4577985.1 hypothetical protein [Kingella kingae]MDK4609439.1 hypothetical protein [Kingella kingae]MDK4625890.1 hypothetical protein [Kingella kingae]MDK4673840.1 hypothetical protein [Kingella kingae]